MKLKIPHILTLVVLLSIVLLYFSIRNDGDAPVYSDLKMADFPDNRDIAAWQWNSPRNQSIAEMHADIDAASENGVTTIYLYIDAYIDIYEQKDAAKVSSDMSDFEKKLDEYLAYAASKNIKVEALSGSANWAHPDYAYLPPLIIEFVHRYNASRPENSRFSKLHFDIESWNAKNYKGNEARVLTDYVTLVDKISELNNIANAKYANNLALSFDVAYWLDNENNSVPQVKRNGVSKYPVFHVIDILASGGDNSIVIMAYRNYAEGKGGSIRQSKAEIDYINDNNIPVKVLVGQETAENEVKSITYFGKGKNDVRIAANQIADYFKDQKPFAGIAIHTLNSYLDLK